MSFDDFVLQGFWHCRSFYVACKNGPWNDLLCVSWWNVEPYSL